MKQWGALRCGGRRKPCGGSAEARSHPADAISHQARQVTPAPTDARDRSAGASSHLLLQESWELQTERKGGGDAGRTDDVADPVLGCPYQARTDYSMCVARVRVNTQCEMMFVYCGTQPTGPDRVRCVVVCGTLGVRVLKMDVA
eukprot:CAMPEP_0115866844 /NCGR_PEP_ID=MMETSP0287-20121206/20461_1 /TAXON_ID=412157 /ORGANISM="Chrysochromulina rotalis, Strain UIO044" /LENGTH=143 /DNA_ID=CAMNT_0003321429 /DNA_START=140 /DNA_END=568 /DNA_ORIENTATION=+